MYEYQTFIDMFVIATPDFIHFCRDSKSPTGKVEGHFAQVPRKLFCRKRPRKIVFDIFSYLPIYRAYD